MWRKIFLHSRDISVLRISSVPNYQKLLREKQKNKGSMLKILKMMSKISIEEEEEARRRMMLMNLFFSYV